MRSMVIGWVCVELCLGAAASTTAAAGPIFNEPLQPKSFTARALVLPPKSVGKTVIRARNTLAVEILIRVQDYLPRNMEPTLLIDDKSIDVDSGVRAVQNKETILGFIVEDPERLKDGAILALQMGELVTTRARVPGEFVRTKVTPLDPGEARKAGVPALSEWFAKKGSAQD